jgi:hypothetical protein
MSKTVRFLAALGSKPVSTAEYAAAVAMLEIDEPQRQALMDRDQVALNGLIGQRDNLCCLIVAAGEEPVF